MNSICVVSNKVRSQQNFVDDAYREARLQRDVRGAKVVLATDDHHQLVHYPVIAAHSKLIRNINVPIPFEVIIRGFTGHSLNKVVNWMYFGQLRFSSEHIGEYLGLSALLGVNGLHHRLERMLIQLASQPSMLVFCLNVAMESRSKTSSGTIQFILCQFASARACLSLKDIRHLSVHSVSALVAFPHFKFDAKLRVINIALVWLVERSGDVTSVRRVLNSVRVCGLSSWGCRYLSARLKQLVLTSEGDPSIPQRAVYVASNDGVNVNVNWVLLPQMPSEWSKSKGESKNRPPMSEESSHRSAHSETRESSRISSTGIESRGLDSDFLRASSARFSPSPEPQTVYSPSGVVKVDPRSGEVMIVPCNEAPKECRNRRSPSGGGANRGDACCVRSDNDANNCGCACEKCARNASESDNPSSNTDVEPSGCPRKTLNRRMFSQDQQSLVETEKTPDPFLGFDAETAYSELTAASQDLRDLFSPSEIQEINAHPNIVDANFVIGKKLFSAEELEDLREIAPLCRCSRNEILNAMPCHCRSFTTMRRIGAHKKGSVPGTPETRRSPRKTPRTSASSQSPRCPQSSSSPRPWTARTHCGSCRPTLKAQQSDYVIDLNADADDLGVLNVKSQNSTYVWSPLEDSTGQWIA